MSRKPKLEVVQDGTQVEQNTEETRGRVARGALDVVIGAFEDFGKNRMSFRRAIRTDNAQQAFIKYLQERERARSLLIKQYDETGKGWENVAEAPAGLVSEILALQTEDVVVDFGESLEITEKELDDFKIEKRNYNILKAIGFLVVKDS